MRREFKQNDMPEAVRSAIEGALAHAWTCMPGEVLSVDLAKSVVSVQITIKSVITSPDGKETSVKMPPLINCPILFPSVGAGGITVPIAVGDEVLVHFASRCIDSWWQSGGIGEQAEFRMHDLSDGFAFPARMSQPKKFANISADNIQIRNGDGDVYVEITPDGKVRAVATDSIVLFAPTVNVQCDEFNVVALTKATITAPTIDLDSDDVQLGNAVKTTFATHIHNEPDGVTEGPVAGS